MRLIPLAIYSIDQLILNLVGDIPRLRCCCRLLMRNLDLWIVRAGFAFDVVLLNARLWLCLGLRA